MTAAFAQLCRILALLGGAALLGAAGVTVVSVLGRYFLNRPISGDIEILSLLMAVAMSLFMPYCQLRKGHVIVDVFTEGAPPRIRALLDAAASAFVLAVAAVLAWRMALGGIELRAFGEESMVLRIPTWIGFTVAVPALALLAVAGLLGALGHLREAAAAAPPGDGR